MTSTNASRSTLSGADKSFCVAIGAAIRARRLGRGVTQAAIAHGAHIEVGYYSAVERGRHNLSVIMLARIAGALEATPDELLKEATRAMASATLRLDC